MMDFRFIVLVQFVLDRETVWLVEARNDVEEISLESCQIVHSSG
jgi:hypothetical protein